MAKLDKTNWITSSHDEFVAKADAILRAAGFSRAPLPDAPPTWSETPGYVILSNFETVEDPVLDDLSDWVVRYPDFGSVFAQGKVQFDLGDDERGQAVLSKVYLNPTWADVLIEGERSCRGRGAPELDHVFLEQLEQNGVGADGAVFWSFIWGS